VPYGSEAVTVATGMQCKEEATLEPQDCKRESHWLQQKSWEGNHNNMTMLL